MSNNVITIKSDGDLEWLVAEIQQNKIDRIESMPPTDMRLTNEGAIEYLSRPCLLKHEVVALLFGMIPHTTETADNFSCLSPGDNVVIRRILAEEKAGKLTYPLRVEEFSAAVMPWLNELPEELIHALSLRFPSNCIAQIDKPAARKNSAADAKTEVVRLMQQALDILQANGIDCAPHLPGTKAPYRDYLRRHSSRLNLSDSTLDDHIKSCGFHWKQSGSQGKKMNSTISKSLGLD